MERKNLRTLEGISDSENVSYSELRHSPLPFYFTSTAKFILIYSVCHLNDRLRSLNFLGRF